MAQKLEREHDKWKWSPLMGSLGSVWGASMGLNLVRERNCCWGTGGKVRMGQKGLALRVHLEFELGNKLGLWF